MNRKDLTTMTNDVVKLHHLMDEYDKTPARKKRESDYRKPGLKLLKRSESEQHDFHTYKYSSSSSEESSLAESLEEELEHLEESEVYIVFWECWAVCDTGYLILFLYIAK